MAERFHLVDGNALYDGLYFRVAELGLGLPLELHVFKLDADDRRQPLAEVLAHVVRIFVLEKVFAPRVVVEHLRQPRTEPRFVHAAFGRGDIVDEGKHAFGIGVGMLYGEFHHHAVLFRLGVKGRVVEGVFSLVEVFDEIDDAAVVFIFHRTLFAALVRQDDMQPLVEKSEFFQPAADGVEGKFRGFENRFVGFEADESPLFVGLYARVFQMIFGHARLHFAARLIHVGTETHFVHGLAEHLDFQPFRKRIRNRRAHAVQTARITVSVLPELAARVQLREHNLHARNALFGMDIRRYSAAVVLHGGAAVGIEFDLYPVGKAVGGLVDGVVHDLPEDMMQAAHARRTDIHAGAHTDGVQPLEYLYISRVIRSFCQDVLSRS